MSDEHVESCCCTIGYLCHLCEAEKDAKIAELEARLDTAQALNRNLKDEIEQRYGQRVYWSIYHAASKRGE